MPRPVARAAIVGVAGPRLTAAERALFQAQPPLGAILFARNIQAPDQLRALTDEEFRDLLGADCPLLVDQEGGRVARLRPPHWPAFPPAATFEGRREALVRQNAALLGLTCVQAGFSVACAPVLDLRLPDTHDVIGDRALSADPAEVARLGRAWVEGLQEAGCLPVIKHIPGHGRAKADSHLELPRVAAPAAALAADCAPFAALAGLGAWAMTAHILYEAWDAALPATLSPTVIGQVIRRDIGFDGLLISDDLAMKALSGSLGALAVQALAAGCDLVLHCSGVLAETAAVLESCPPVGEAAAARLAASQAAMATRRRPLDATALLAARDAALAAA